LARLLERFPQPIGAADDCEVVRVDVVGESAGRKRLTRLETTVYAHKQWNASCGALDTGVPPSIVAQMIGDGTIKQRGVLAPESCVPAQPFFRELSRRQITMRKISEEYLNS
jgi:lysine 6-dehydrogenase